MRESRRLTRALSSPVEETSAYVMAKAPPAEYPFLAPPEGPGEIGRLGGYLIHKVLGTGAMGIVFEAQDGRLKRRVALKVMKPALAAHPEFRRRFLREGQLAAALDHEHIVTIYQVGEARGIPFLALKLLQGEALEDRLKRVGKLPLAEVLRIGQEIAEGLAAAHAQGLVHRDIKPANIWLEEGRDRVKIVDFGLARGDGPELHFTQAGMVIGTPSYMAPEQARAEEVDGRCDLFSLGTVLYRACTGQLPFDGKDSFAVLAALVKVTPVPPHQLAPRMPPALSALVMRLLAKDRNDRPQSAREVVECIQAVERDKLEEANGRRQPPVPSQQGADAPRSPDLNEKTPSNSWSEVISPSASGAGSGATPASPKRRSRRSRRKKRRGREMFWSVLLLVGAMMLLAGAILFRLHG